MGEQSQLAPNASASPEETKGMPYQIIDAVMARAVQADTARTHPLFAWIVMRDVPKYPGAFVARLVADAPQPTPCSLTPSPNYRPNCRQAWNV